MLISPQQFELLLPLAVEWAKEQETIVLKSGEPLNQHELDYAQKIGVLHPEKVRLLNVSAMPQPANPILRQAAELTGLLGTGTAGLTLRYAIFIRNDCYRHLRLVVHELVHTHQYERMGGFEPFLRQYLLECLTAIYPNGALEQEVLRKEHEFFGPR
jgi:hypothetical protein